ncbi:diaminopimelate decarboxylase [Schaalia naturae]|uniref:Diaminopimelate decarboxylase n=1 Tax=Schaalia naturae TaxID=635203 RepID=A0ABW2SK76_9ACTO
MDPSEAPLGSLVCPEPGERPDLWPTAARRDRDGALMIGGARLGDLQRGFGSPSYILDRADLRGRARVWASAMAEEFWEGYGMAGGRAYYAAKALACADVVRVVTAEGMGVDAASLGELTIALCAGADPALVGLHGNNKLDGEIDLAIAAGIARVVVDSLPEVARLEAAAARRGVGVPVMVRLKTGIHAGGNEYIATSHEDQKFGVSVNDGGAMEVVRAIAASGHLRLVGLHNHIGSQIEGVGAFVAAARIVLDFRGRIAREHGIWVPEVDLGGGLGIAYSGADPVPTSPATLARALAEVVRERCVEQGSPIPRVSVEPGRSVIGPACVTVYEVGTLKDVSLEGGAVRRYVSVDGGMSDNIRPALYGAVCTATLANRASAGPWARCRVVGRHCESGDIVVRDVDLPADLRPGDLLAVPATGAYGWSMASNYNYLTKPGVLAVEDGAARWAVRPQTLEDLMDLDPGLAGRPLP